MSTLTIINDDGVSIRITRRQAKALTRARRDREGSVPMSRDLGKQLLRKGLVFDTHQIYERVDWGQFVVSALPVYTLTAAGEEVADAIILAQQ